MKVRATKRCFLGGTLREVGDVFEWGGAKAPSYLAPVKETPKPDPKKPGRNKGVPVEAPKAEAPTGDQEVI